MIDLRILDSDVLGLRCWRVQWHTNPVRGRRKGASRRHVILHRPDRIDAFPPPEMSDLKRLGSVMVFGVGCLDSSWWSLEVAITSLDLTP